MPYSANPLLFPVFLGATNAFRFLNRSYKLVIFFRNAGLGVLFFLFQKVCEALDCTQHFNRRDEYHGIGLI
jgi:hypothetical protein